MTGKVRFGRVVVPTFAMALATGFVSPAHAQTLNLVINEIKTQSKPDWVELYNPTSSPIRLKGWSIKDEKSSENLPAEVSVPAGGFYVYEPEFGLGKSDEVSLRNGGKTVDRYSWSSHGPYARTPDGIGDFKSVKNTTRGVANDSKTFKGVLESTGPEGWPTGLQIKDLKLLADADWSGADFDSEGNLWVVNNGTATLAKLTYSGNGSYTVSQTWTMQYPNGSGTPDAEGVTIGPDGAIYVATERDNGDKKTSRPSVLRYVPTSRGGNLPATNEWNFKSIANVSDHNGGLEAISYIPDFGANQFAVGVEETGEVLFVELDPKSNSTRLLQRLKTPFSGVMALDYRQEEKQLRALCDDACNGQSILLEFDPGAQKWAQASEVESRPANLGNTANEGYASYTLSGKCVSGKSTVTTRFAWVDDGESDGVSIRTAEHSTEVECKPEPTTPPAIPTTTKQVTATVTASTVTTTPTEVASTVTTTPTVTTTAKTVTVVPTTTADAVTVVPTTTADAVTTTPTEIASTVTTTPTEVASTVTTTPMVTTTAKTVTETPRTTAATVTETPTETVTEKPVLTTVAAPVVTKTAEAVTLTEKPSAVTTTADAETITETPAPSTTKVKAQTVTETPGEVTITAATPTVTDVPAAVTTTRGDGESVEDSLLLIDDFFVATVGRDVEEQLEINGIDIEELPEDVVSVEGLPAGLRYDAAARRIIGIPEVTGTATATVQLADGDVSRTGEIRIAVIAPATVTETAEAEASSAPESALEVLVPRTATGTVGLPLEIPVRVVGEGEVTVDGLPEGLTFDNEKSRIHGAPTAAGESTAVISINDGEQTASAELQISVEDLPTVTVTPEAPSEDGEGKLPISSVSGTKNEPLKVQLELEGVENVEVTGLPRGLRYDAQLGAITGRPEESGTFEVVVVTQRGDQKLETALNLEVAEGRKSSETETVTVTPTQTPVPGAENTGSAEGSSISDRCVAALAGWGVPLIALVPLAAISQMGLPVAAELQASIDSAMRSLNEQFGGSSNSIATQYAIDPAVRKQLEQVGGVMGGIAIAALVVGTIVNACAEGEGSSR